MKFLLKIEIKVAKIKPAMAKFGIFAKISPSKRHVTLAFDPPTPVTKNDF